MTTGYQGFNCRDRNDDPNCLIWRECQTQALSLRFARSRLTGASRPRRRHPFR
jgi:hypothetical protein